MSPTDLHASAGPPWGGPFLWLRRRRAAALLTGLVLAAAPPAQAQQQVQPQAPPLTGPHHIVLHNANGQRLVVGQVNFTPAGTDGLQRFELKMDHSRYTDYFLSMREMKCLPGGTEILCHIPYPYSQPGTINTAAGPTQFAWLEHGLLFMYKKPSDFGAKLWNGVYFELRRTPLGLEGKPQAVDLNQIAAPPARLDVPPFKPAWRDDMAAGARWFNRLTIEAETGR